MRLSKYLKVALSGLIPLVILSVIILIVSAVPGKTEGEENSQTIYGSVYIPKTVSFAGETMPIDRFDVREALDRELMSNAYFHSQTIRFIKMAPRYFSIIEPILKEKGIPADFKYLAVAESNLNPRSVSPALASGFWQFMRGTALQYGLEVNDEVDERFHVEKSTYAACDYLLDSYRKYKNWGLVAASYNAGVGRIDQQQEKQKIESYYDLLLVEETSRYLYRSIALKLIMETPEKYNFSIPENDKYPLIRTRNIEINGAVANLADFAKSHGISYKWLKDFNPWLRDTKLTNKTGKKYVIKIPVV
jgi:hypothetical protein